MRIFYLICFVFFVTNVHAFAEPYMVDPNFLIEKYVAGGVGVGPKFPTKMAFLGEDILVLEKYTGNIRLVRDGELQKKPLLHFNVDQNRETGLLGITTLNSTVYLYFTEVKPEKPVVFGKFVDLEDILGNRIYKYNWDGENLLDGVLVKDLPFDPARLSFHSGGSMATGLDGTIFAVIGDTNRRGLLQNFETGDFEDAGVIIIVNYDEKILKPSQTENPLEHYYAMGIRNSFGIAIDPVTGFLWDTENGHIDFDEINLVEPKFNSGWKKIQGPSTENQVKNLPKTNDFTYSDPEFSWEQTVAPTGLVFVNSELFSDYSDSLLVADFNTGTIYRFKLNSERTGFVFDDPGLEDLVLNAGDNFDEIIFASGFGGLTDLKFGPDGLLYVLSHVERTIYRIVPTESTNEISEIIIPIWIKNNAGWWANHQITDSEFVSGIQYLINHGVMKIPKSSHEMTSETKEIPSWVKDNAGRWADDMISDMEFVSGVQHLITNDFVKLDVSHCNSSISIRANFENCQQIGRDLSNSDLMLGNFKGSNLRNANLSNSDLSMVHFDKANLVGTNLSNSKLIMANFRDANLTNSKLVKATLLFAQMEGATLEGADLTNSNFNKANLRNVNLNAANMSQISFKYARLGNAQIIGADLSNSYLYSSHFENADLSDSNLTDSNLNWAIFENATMKNTDLSNSFLKGVSFKNANLNKAVLNYANFDIARLTDTNFHEATLIGANLTTARFLGEPIFKNANLSDADLHGARIFNTDFTGAILINTDFSGSILNNVDFSGADITNVDLTGANMTNVNFNGSNLEDAKGGPFTGCINHTLCT